MDRTIFKTYIPINNNADSTHLKITMYYNSEKDKRGYYILAFPVKREEKDGYVMESFTAYSGFKMRVLQVARKSTKAEGEARDFVRNHLDSMITSHFGNLELAEHNIKELI